MKFRVAGIPRPLDSEQLKAGDLYAADTADGREFYIVAAGWGGQLDIQIAKNGVSPSKGYSAPGIRPVTVLVYDTEIQIRPLGRQAGAPVGETTPNGTLLLTPESTSIQCNSEGSVPYHIDLATGKLVSPGYYRLYQVSWSANLLVDDSLVELFRINAPESATPAAQS